MVADCIDAAAWCRHNLPALHGTSEKWVVGGASSGATLAAMVAHAEQPDAFVSVYGLLDTAHYLDDEKCRPAYEEGYLTSEAEVERAMQDRDPRNASTQNPWADEFPPHVSLQEARDALGLPAWTPSRENLLRVDMYTYVARHQNLMDVIYRREQFADDAAFRAHVEANSPTQLLKSKTTFPPTFFLHGDRDNIVPTLQTTNMAERLREMEVPHQVHYEPGAGHVYDFAFEVSWGAKVPSF